MLPTKPLNIDYLHQYSRELALQLANKFFTNTDFITGEQIVEFSNIKQINFLVLKILEERWEAETARLESPFFDYASKEVQEGLRVFLNVLSQHIKVQKKTFTAVLIEAIFGTLLLVLDPRSFYEQEIQKSAKIKLLPENYRRIIKYLQYNREIFKTFVGEIALKHPNGFDSDAAMLVWQNTLRDHWRYIEPIEWRIKAFDSLLQLDIDDIYTRAEIVEAVTVDDNATEDETIQEPAEEKTEPETVLETLPTHVEEEKEPETVFETLPTHLEEEKEPETVFEPLPTHLEEEKEPETVFETLPSYLEEEKAPEIVFETLPTHLEEEKAPEIVFETLPTHVEEEKEPETYAAIDLDPKIQERVSQYFENIEEDIKEEKAIVLEKQPEKPAENIVSQYRQDKVKSLLEAIPLHEKFTFIDELFGGDNLAFQDALEKIDHSPNYEEARRLTNQYILQHNWDFDQDSTQEFLAWLGRRF